MSTDEVFTGEVFTGRADPADPPRHAAEPLVVISEIVVGADPALDPGRVQQVVAEVVASRRGRRRLAQVLQDNPRLLTSGRSNGVRSIELLVPALRAIGARRLVTPRCPRCDREARLVLRSGSERICRPCANEEMPPCASCGKHRYVARRDHHGQPYCSACVPDEPADPVEVICEIIGLAAPAFPREHAARLVVEALPQSIQRSRTAAALAGDPALLTGQGARGTPRIIALIDALIDAGADGVIRPDCPGCGSDERPLRFTAGDGLRCCRRCYEVKHQDKCGSCGRLRAVAGRDPHGRPLCKPCGQQANHQAECSACGQRRVLFHLGDRLCRTCFTMPSATCSVCGRTRPCYHASTDRPRCEACAARLRPRPRCTGCGNTRRVYARGPDGEPFCPTCKTPRERCRDCRTIKRVRGRTAQGQALCRACYPKDPVSLRECVECGQVSRLFHHGLCDFCALQAAVHALLTEPDGQIRPDRELLYHALLRGNPRTSLKWLRRPGTHTLLSTLLDSGKPISHHTLDGGPSP